MAKKATRESYGAALVQYGADERIVVFQLDFHREITMGSTFNLYQSKQDNILLSKGVSSEGEKMFSCSVEFKK